MEQSLGVLTSQTYHCVSQWPNDSLTCRISLRIKWWKRRGTGQKRGKGARRVLGGSIFVDNLATHPAAPANESGYPEAQP